VSWRILLVIGAVLALACAGLALYSSDQPAAKECTSSRDLVRGDPGYTDPEAPGVDDDYAWLRNKINAICFSYSDAPLPILRSGAERWWWFSAIAVSVLTLAVLPLLVRRST
jgi:hypothetical protein